MLFYEKENIFYLEKIKKISENPYLPLSEEQLLQKLELSRKHAEQGQYRNADDVISDMRAKYGL